MCSQGRSEPEQSEPFQLDAPGRRNSLLSGSVVQAAPPPYSQDTGVLLAGGPALAQEEPGLLWGFCAENCAKAVPWVKRVTSAVWESCTPGGPFGEADVRRWGEGELPSAVGGGSIPATAKFPKECASPKLPNSGSQAFDSLAELHRGC